MKIGYDAKRAFFNTTGLGNYSRTFLKQMLNSDYSAQYFLFSPKEPENYYDLVERDGVTVVLPKKFLSKQLKSMWRSVWLGKAIKNQNIQLFHGLSQELPLDIQQAGCGAIVTIHDLIFLRYKEGYTSIDIETYRQKAKFACEKADHIIAISRQTKQDIINYFDIPAEKISVVYQDCSEFYKRPIKDEDVEKIKEKYNLPENFVLSVGALTHRKNNNTLIEAIAKTEKNVHLVIAGSGSQRKRLEHLVAELELSNKVTFLGFVPNEDLKALYHLAEIYVYPSLFEGFGIPILESLYAKTPVITGKVGCFSEVGGECAIYVDQTDSLEMSNAIDALFLEPDRQKKLLQNVDGHLKKFKANNTFPQVQSIYNQVLKVKGVNFESPKLSALLITYNEESNIREYLNNYAFAGELIVVDSFSTDNTVKIIKEEFPHVRVEQRKFDNFTAQRNYTINLATGDWVMFFDADERIGEDLKTEILDTVSNPKSQDCYYIHRYFYFHEKKIRYSGWKNDKVVRLFKNNGIKYDDKYLVHEQINCNNIGSLRCHLHHYSMRNEIEYRGKLSQYAKLRAEELFKKGVKASFLRKLIKPKFRFFKHYIIQFGFLDGKEGYVIAKMYHDYVQERYAHLDELWENNQQ